MRYRVVHTTQYDYSLPVSACHNEAHLRPRTTAAQRCLSHQVTIEPAAAVRAERDDAFGNRVLYFAIEAEHLALTVTAASEVEVQPPSAAGAARTASWEEVAASMRTAADRESRAAHLFVVESPLIRESEEIRAYAGVSMQPGRPLIDAVRDLNTRIFHDFQFDPEVTTVATPLTEVLAQRGGVCQDFAHLAIACLRSFGLPARYVSGYLETTPPPGQPRLEGADASHAWVATFVPGWGWIEIDPTNDQMPDERYVTTAWGRDFSDVTPLKGVIFGGGAHSLRVGVDMARVE